jgi:hypothetical protein
LHIAHGIVVHWVYYRHCALYMCFLSGAPHIAKLHVSAPICVRRSYPAPMANLKSPHSTMHCQYNNTYENGTLSALSRTSASEGGGTVSSTTAACVFVFGCTIQHPATQLVRCADCGSEENKWRYCCCLMRKTRLLFVHWRERHMARRNRQDTGQIC